MTTRQKRAIYYSIMRRKRERQAEFLESKNLMQDFQNSKYKYMTTYINDLLKRKIISGDEYYKILRR